MASLIPSAIPNGEFVKPAPFNSPNLRFYAQDPAGGMSSAPHKGRLQIARVEALCGKILCVMAPAGAVVFLAANSSITSIIAAPFAVIAVSCIGAFLFSKIVLDVTKPSYEKFLACEARRFLSTEDLENAHRAIYALAKVQIGEFSFCKVMGEVFGLTSQDAAFKIRDELYLELATKYAQQQDYHNALRFMPCSSYCDRQQMENFLTLIKEIEGVPAIVKRLDLNTLYLVWQLATNTKNLIPTTEAEYRDVYENLLRYYTTNMNTAIPQDDNQGYYLRVCKLNNKEPSQTIQAFRFSEWRSLMHMRMAAGQNLTKADIDSLA